MDFVSDWNEKNEIQKAVELVDPRRVPVHPAIPAVYRDNNNLSRRRETLKGAVRRVHKHPRGNAVGTPAPSEDVLKVAFREQYRRIPFCADGWTSFDMREEWVLAGLRADFAFIGTAGGKPLIRIFELKKHANAAAVMQAWLYGDLARYYLAKSFGGGPIRIECYVVGWTADSMSWFASKKKGVTLLVASLKDGDITLARPRPQRDPHVGRGNARLFSSNFERLMAPYIRRSPV